jgi:hypothetical protein
MFRRRQLVRILALTFLIIQIQAILAPLESYALTGGPAAPEFSTFQAVDTTDMVSLQTGDFSYNLPVVEVPGPAGGYPLSLGYSAGITMEQEASWVGLGWTLNAGSINRSVSGSPDDWNGQRSHMHSYNVGDEEVYRGLSVNAQIPFVIGVGFSVKWGPLGLMGVNLNGMYNGATLSLGSDGVGIGYAFTSELSLGMHGGADGLSFNASLSSGFSASISANGISVNSHELFGSLGVSLSTSGQVRASASSRISVAGNSSSFSQQGNVSTEVIDNGVSVDLIVLSVGYEEMHYRWWVDEKVNQKTIGSLYLNTPIPYAEAGVRTEELHDFYTIPMIEIGGISSMNSDQIDANHNLAAAPNVDKYFVSAQGLIGSIRPMFTEPGTIYRDNRHIKYTSQGEPVEFLSTLRNNTTSANLFTRPRVHFAFEGSSEGYYETAFNDFQQDGSIAPIIKSSTSDGRTTFNSLTGRIGKSRHIEYFTSDSRIIGFEITAEDGKIYEFKQPAYVHDEITFNRKKNVGVNDDFVNSYLLSDYAYSWLLTALKGPDYIDRGAAGLDAEDWGYWVKFSYGKWTDAYQWRTPGTGFIEEMPSDRNVHSIGRKELYYLNSIETATHIAYFIKSLRLDGLSSAESQPNFWTQRLTKNKALTLPDCNGVLGSCVANIRPAETTQMNIKQEKPVFSLKLERIVLFKKSTLTSISNFPISQNELVDANANSGESSIHFVVDRRESGFGGYAAPCRFNGQCGLNQRQTIVDYGRYIYTLHYSSNVIDINDWALLSQSIKDQALKTIDFTYNYSLAPGTPGSNAENQGRLTLSAVRFVDFGSAAVEPPYQFEYESHINGATQGYAKDKADHWGYNAGDRSIRSNSDYLDIIDKPAAVAWSLKSIKTPIGSEIKIQYESDTYKDQVALPINMHKFRASYDFANQKLTLLLDGLSESAKADIKSIFVVGGSYYPFFKYQRFSSEPEPLPNRGCIDEYAQLETGGEATQLLAINPDGTMQFDFGFTNFIDENNYCRRITYSFTQPGEIGFIQSTSFGGGIRVRSISTSDPLSNRGSLTEYDYTNPTTGVTSGVTSYAPVRLDNNREISFITELPGPGVSYEYVTARQIGLDGRSNGFTRYRFEVMRRPQTSNNPYLMNAYGVIGDEQFLATSVVLFGASSSSPGVNSQTTYRNF